MKSATLLLTLTTLAACSVPSPPPPPKPLPVAGTIDGLYRGTSTRFQADARTCPHPGLVTFTVQDRSFRYRLNGAQAIDATVTREGLISGQFGDFTLTGDWNGAKLEGDVTSATCAMHFRALKRSPA